MWFYKDQPVFELIEGFESFVYLIERLNVEVSLDAPIYYIGKKNFYSRRKEKGKTVIYESDWQSYYGSSDELNADIKRYGVDNFKRTILHFCKTKGDSGYLEIYEQMTRNVLGYHNGRKLYYNKNINSRYHTTPDIPYLAPLHIYSNLECVDGSTKGKTWVNNKKVNKLVPAKDILKFVGNNGWVQGKIKPNINNSFYTEHIKNDEYNIITLFKGRQYIHAHINDVDRLKLEGWVEYNQYQNSDVYYANNGVSVKQFDSYDNMINFVNSSLYWQEGAEINTVGKVMIDMNRDELVRVTPEQISSDKMLTPVNTKRIKVKQKNRIIFEGYLNHFVYSFNVPVSLVKKALTNNGIIPPQTGKFKDRYYDFVISLL